MSKGRSTPYVAIAFSSVLGYKHINQAIQPLPFPVEELGGNQHAQNASFSLWAHAYT